MGLALEKHPQQTTHTLSIIPNHSQGWSDAGANVAGGWSDFATRLFVSVPVTALKE
jgi:hypothetical protein